MDKINLNLAAAAGSIVGRVVDTKGSYSTSSQSTIVNTGGLAFSFSVVDLGSLPDYAVSALKSGQAKLLMQFQTHTDSTLPLTVQAFAAWGDDFFSVEDLMQYYGPTTVTQDVILRAANQLNANTDNPAYSYTVRAAVGAGIPDINNDDVQFVDVTPKALEILGKASTDKNLLVYFRSPSGTLQDNTSIRNVGVSEFSIVNVPDQYTDPNYVVTVGPVASRPFDDIVLKSALPVSLLATADPSAIPINVANPNAPATPFFDTSTATTGTNTYRITQSRLETGVLSGPGLSAAQLGAPGEVVYTFSGTATQASTLLRSLTFTPAAGLAAANLQTTLKLTESSGLGSNTLGSVVLYGGVATANTIEKGQTQNVEAGGRSFGTTLHGTGNVKAGGVSEKAFVQGGVLNLASGATSSGSVVQDGTAAALATETVSGTAVATGSAIGVFGQQVLRGGGSSVGTVIKNGGLQTVVASSTASGTHVLAGGVQVVQVGGADVGAVIDAGGRQDVNGSATGAAVSGTQNVQTGARADQTSVSAGGTQYVSLQASVTNTRLRDAGSVLTLVAGSASGVDAGPGTTVSVTGGAGASVSGVRGVGALVKTGTGVLALSGSASYEGDVTISGGTLAVAGDGTLGASRGMLTLAGGALQLANAASIGHQVTLKTAVQVQVGAGAATISSVIGGSGALLKVGGGTLVLDGKNTHAGGIELQAGALSVKSDAALGAASAPLKLLDGTFDATASFTSSRNVVLGAAPIVKVEPGAELRLAGVVSGVALNKTGEGVLTLAGANTYAGGTTVSAGVLSVAADTALGASSGGLTLAGGGLQATASFASARVVTLSTAASIKVEAGATLALNGSVAGTGALTKTGAGQLTLGSATNSYAGGATIAAGVLAVSSDGALGASGGALTFTGGTLQTASAFTIARAVHLTAGGTVQVDGSAALTLAGAVDGAGALTKTGDGALVLSGSNSFTGGLVLKTGVLELTAPAAASGGAITFGEGDATLKVDGAAALPNAVRGFDIGDGLDLAGLSYVSGASATLANGVLTVTSGAASRSFAAFTLATGVVVGQGGVTLSVAQDAGSGVFVSLVGAGAPRLTGSALASVASPVLVAGSAATVAENTTAATTVYRVQGTSALTLTYSLSGADAAKFAINVATGAVSFVTPPDFEQPGATDGSNTYRFTATATDSAGARASQAVSVTVADVNDTAPVVVSDGAVAVASGVQAGATIYTAAATDADSVNGARSYSLSGADAGLFALDSATGALSFRSAPPAAAVEAVYNVTVQAGDGVNASAAKPVVVTVAAAAANAYAPVFTSGAAVSVDENAAAGSVVYTAVAVDADADAVTFTLSGADADAFTFDPTTGEVRLKVSPDFERPGAADGSNIYSLSLTASDGAGGHVTTQALAVTVANLNDASPAFTSAASASTPENVATTAAVYTAAATDADGDAVTYAFAGGADDARFDIDATTGAVTFKASPDFEAPGSAAGTNTYAVKVAASDGVAAHTTQQAVLITVTDATEPTPAAAAAAPSVPAGTTTRLDGAGAPVLTGDVATQGVAQFSSPGSTTYTGVISGTGSVEKTGAGTLVISGTNTYSGPTTVSSGVLAVNGSIANSPVTVGSGATLGGSGTTGPVTLQAGATFSPGNSPGTISTGALALAAGAAFKVEIGGLGSADVDRVNVTGAVNVAGAVLNASLFGGFAAPANSAPLVIISNDGTDAVTGTFAGLAEGATFTLGGVPVRISYAGGDGNDVTLQFVTAGPPAAGGGGGTTAPTTPTTPTPVTPTPPVTPTTPATPAAPSVALGLATSTANLLRIGAPALGALPASSPLAAQYQSALAISAKLDAGLLGATDAQAQLYHLVDGTTSVAVTSYAFFTGKTPTAAGLNYLVNSPGNATDLNDAYYARFSTENRYINFAVNLGRFGADTAAYHAAYDALDLRGATAKAYLAVFGTTPDAAKLDALLDTAVPNGLGGTETRAQYFADYGTDGLNGVGAKAAMIGWLMAEAVKASLGPYAQADLHFLQDLAHGTAQHNVDLLATYGPTPTLVGQPLTDPSVGG